MPEIINIPSTELINYKGAIRLRKFYLTGLFFTVIFLSLQAILLVTLSSENVRLGVNMAGALISSLLAAAVLTYTARQTRLSQPRLFPSWLMLALAMLCNPLSGILAGILLLIKPDFDSIPFVNFFILIVYPLFFLMVALLPSRTTRKLELIQWLFDAFVIVLSITLIFWVYVFQPALDNKHSDMAHFIYSIASQVGDLLMVWAMVMILFRRLKYQRISPLWWLFGGFSILLVYDLITASVSSSFGVGTYGSMKEVLLNASILFVTLAGLKQLLALKKPTVVDTEETLTGWWETIRLIMPYVGLGASFWVLISNITNPKATDPKVIAIWVLVILVIIIIRQVLVIRENQRLSEQLFNLNTGLEKRVAERTEALITANLELKERENRMAHNASHDALTDLPNRILLIDRIEQSIVRMRRDSNYSFGVLFMDLDGFKVVNDSMGHATGDKLLINFAQKLKSCIREIDTVARLGGDEFVILLDGCTSGDSLVQTAQRVIQMLATPYKIGDQYAYLGASLGIVPGSPDYDDPSDLLRDADLAMYEAKALGKAQYVVFTPELRSKALTRMVMEKDLRLALENKELYLNYQPIINLSDGKILGLEALIRWRHPDLGLISPGIFIPIAESNGTVVPVTFWVMEEALRQLCEWQKEFPDVFLSVSVNLSARLFNLPDLMNNIERILSQAQIPPKKLILEITESALIQNASVAIQVLKDCQKLGILVHMDDFGTGYSSLNYLHNFPLNALKIAQEFVLRILPGGENREIVQTIVTLARDLNLEVIAEGIETLEQMEFIRNLGCQGGQGYFISRPLSPEDASIFIRRNSIIQTR